MWLQPASARHQYIGSLLLLMRLKVSLCFWSQSQCLTKKGFVLFSPEGQILRVVVYMVYMVYTILSWKE